MFICKECLGDDPFYMPQSHGPCEVCEKTKNCYDIHHSQLPELKSDPDKKSDQQTQALSPESEAEMYLWNIEDEESIQLIKWAREKYLRSMLETEGAEEAYYEIVHSFVSTKLIERRIISGIMVEIAFSNSTCKCIYEGVQRGKIIYRDFTKKGKPYKTKNTTSWDMWEHIKRVEP